MARELESQWEKALGQERQLQEEYARFRQELPAGLSRAERADILALAQDLPQLWDAPTTTPEDRQIVIRHLVDQVRVRVAGDSEAVAVTIQWKGGFASQHTLRRGVLRYRQLGGCERLLQRVRELRAAGQGSPAIAARLNAEGFRTPRNTLFRAGTVRSLLSREGLSRSRPELPFPEGRGRDEWWVSDLARELNMSATGLHGWIRRGWVQARQRGVGARCWIIWADAEEMTRLRRLQAQRQAPYPSELTTPKVRPGAKAGRSKAGRGRSRKGQT